VNRLRAFGRFWYDFVVGDDWRIAVAVVAGLVLTWALTRSAVDAWWLLPLAFVLAVPLTLWHAVRRSR
jgi:hypothetical protein